jgi:hypothetical protein
LQYLLKRPGDMGGSVAVDADATVPAFQVVNPDLNGGDAAIAVAADSAQVPLGACH